MKSPPATHYANIHGVKTPVAIVEDFHDGWLKVAFKHPTLKGVVAETIVHKVALEAFGTAL